MVVVVQVAVAVGVMGGMMGDIPGEVGGCSRGPKMAVDSARPPTSPEMVEPRGSIWEGDPGGAKEVGESWNGGIGEPRG